MKNKLQELETIFIKANERFIRNNPMLFISNVSERTLCGALMAELYNVIKYTKYSDYYVDVEYNRNVGGKLKTIMKTDDSHNLKIITINCDLIVHSRGKKIHQDNLIALEMKKSTASKIKKNDDKERLKCLTKRSYDDIWSADGKTFPKHVCGYLLGIYYEINYKKKTISIEYYKEGNCYKKFVIDLSQYI